MPVIKSARKKLRQDIARTKRNLTQKTALKAILKKARRAPNPTNFSQLASALDKAVKVHLIHKNKASRLKSRTSKLAK